MNWYNDFLNKLKNSGIADADTQLCVLTEFVSGIPYSEIIKKRILAAKDKKVFLSLLSDEQIEDLENKVFLRAEGVPLQYITGKTDFYGREFRCRRGVLIPRFDTETLVDAALTVLNDGDSLLDLCCGSGCAGITLALERKIMLDLADISPDAVELARVNAEQYGVNAGIFLYDVFHDKLKKQYNVIVCNPPYIKSGEIKDLSKDVRTEPVLALDGGIDGLDFYRYISSNYTYALKPGGRFVFECGAGQSEAVADLLEKAGFADISVKKDYAGINRVLIAGI